jgi:hypothetical protein
LTDLPPARILDVSPEEYHKLPGFSASLAKIAIARSVLHAKDAYDRKREQIALEDESDDEVSDDKQKRLDYGSILHALVLGIGKRIEVIPSTLLSKSGSYGTAAAKEARDAARASGRIPVKEPDMEKHERVGDAIRSRLATAGHILDGRSEFAIEWHEATPHGPVQCRAMLDHFIAWGLDPRDETGPVGAIIDDLKMVCDAHPERCQRTAENLHYAIQAAAYQRALAALYPRLGGRIKFQFLFCETSRPYALWDPPRMSGAFHEIGERRWIRARNAWADVLATGKAPSYREMGHDEITAPMYTLRNEGFTPEEM